MTKLQNELREFRRLWLFVTVVTWLLVAATVTLNVMHAPGGVIAHSIGGSAPVLMFVCVEFIARIPGTSPWLTAGRISASVVVAGICFGISWQQQVNFMLSVGYQGWTVYAYPVMIDGVTLVAVLSLVEVTRKVRSLRAALADLADSSAPVVRPVTPAETAAEQAGREYRESLARARSDAAAGTLIRKPFELTPVTDAA
jgi:hypothetical protein